MLLDRREKNYKVFSYRWSNKREKKRERGKRERERERKRERRPKEIFETHPKTNEPDFNFEFKQLFLFASFLSFMFGYNNNNKKKKKCFVKQTIGLRNEMRAFLSVFSLTFHIEDRPRKKKKFGGTANIACLRFGKHSILFTTCSSFFFFRTRPDLSCCRSQSRQ